MTSLFTLGIHCNHDASVSVCKNNEVIFSISEERITGIKHYAGFPIQSIKRALQYCGIKAKEIEQIAFTSEKIFFPDHKNSYIIDLEGKKIIITKEMMELNDEFIILTTFLSAGVDAPNNVQQEELTFLKNRKMTQKREYAKA